MRNRLIFAIAIILIISFGVSITYSAEIKTLEDFKNSIFLKKYSPKRDMKSWPLRDGGYNNSFGFQLGTDEYSWFSIEIVTKSKNNPIIINCGISFHDESDPLVHPTKFTMQIKTIFSTFLNSIDPSLPTKDINNYVQKQSLSKYRVITDAPKKTYGKYSFRVGTVTHMLIIDIDKEY